MSFQTGLSGLNAASRNLDVIGNNIANANTTGMKQSRTEFSAIVASTLGAAANSSSGIGVGVGAISQQFTQGNISITGNNLDVAINGSGFIQLKQPDGSFSYTRDGTLKVDKDGFLKTSSGATVLGFPTDPKTGKAASVLLQTLTIPTGAPISAKGTTVVTAEFNLDARAKVAAGDLAAVPPILPTPRSTYGTSINVYDNQGVAAPMQLYFEKSATANQWSVHNGVDTPAVVGPPALAAVTFPAIATLTFDLSGKLTTVAPAGTSTAGAIPGTFNLGANTINSPNPNLTAGTLPQALTVDLTKITQFGSVFAVSNLSQDGYTSGEMTGLTIGENGTIAIRYSNGQTQYSGQIALADFRNAQGLSPLGGNAWAATFESGAPVSGAPGAGKFGGLRAGALEDSNVDLTSELVNMMTAQRAYQANAQTIKTQDQVMSTLVNLR